MSKSLTRRECVGAVGLLISAIAMGFFILFGIACIAASILEHPKMGALAYTGLIGMVISMMFVLIGFILMGHPPGSGPRWVSEK